MEKATIYDTVDENVPAEGSRQPYHCDGTPLLGSEIHCQDEVCTPWQTGIGEQPQVRS